MLSPTKYPRTVNLPWSNLTEGELELDKDIEWLRNSKEVIVTEKLDGQIYSIYKNYSHARSLEDNHHKSASYMKNVIAPAIQYSLPDNWRVNGEYLYATHSIKYTGLESYFYIHSIFADGKVFSWDKTVEYANDWGFPVTPVLYCGKFIDNEIKKCYTGKSTAGVGLQEGYVVRDSGFFSVGHWYRNVAKFVRPNHVSQEAQNWQLRWDESKINELR